MDGVVAISTFLLAILFEFVTAHHACFTGSVYDPRSGTTRWFLSTNDPCSCSAIQVGGVIIQTPAYLQGAPYHLDQPIQFESQTEIKEFFKCKDECHEGTPLGLEDGSIPDSNISCSYQLDFRPCKDGRLNNDIWWGASNNDGAWIEVDLGRRTSVTGVITQGSKGREFRVTRYKVSYKVDAASESYTYVTNSDGDPKVFEGNVIDGDTAVSNNFEPPFVASVIRIIAVTYEQGIALRLEILGCPEG